MNLLGGIILCLALAACGVDRPHSPGTMTLTDGRAFYCDDVHIEGSTTWCYRDSDPDLSYPTDVVASVTFKAE